MADALYSTPFGGTDRGASTTVLNHTLDANNDGLAFIFQTDSADAITHLGFRYGARTGTPPTYIIGLEGVDASTGNPDGTYLGGGTPASSTFTPPADATWDGLWKWEALDNSYTPTRGQLMALTIRYSSGTVDGSNFSTFTRNSSVAASIVSLPYANTLTGGTWAKQIGQCFGYRTASGRHGIIAQSVYSTTESTSGNRQAMHFTLPSGHGDTFTVLGMRGAFRLPSGSMILGLWDAAGSVIQSITLDTDKFNTFSPPQAGRITFDEASLTALNFGTKYYIGFESVSSSAVGIAGIQLAEAADRHAYPYGESRGLSTWNGSAWTDDDTVLPILDIVLGDITEPSGGGAVFMPRAIQVGL
jgi:hypothetical protein